MRSLIRPVYIPVEQIESVTITHLWNDWDPYKALGWPAEPVKSALSVVSNRGITAFALGCAEWVIYRLSNFFDDELPFHYIAAFWMYVMGDEESIPMETDHEDWIGVIRGPINFSLMTTLNTIYLAEDGPPVQNGALAANVVKHVLAETGSFDRWEKEVLARLQLVCLRDSFDPDGQPIPREVLDPDFDVKMTNMEGLIDKFVAKLKPIHNLAIGADRD